MQNVSCRLLGFETSVSARLVGTCNKFCLEIVLNTLIYLGFTPQGSCVGSNLDIFLLLYQMSKNNSDFIFDNI